MMPRSSHASSARSSSSCWRCVGAGIMLNKPPPGTSIALSRNAKRKIPFSPCSLPVKGTRDYRSRTEISPVRSRIDTAAASSKSMQSFTRAPQCACEKEVVCCAGPELRKLAAQLPGWKDASVSQWEMSSVLLEFLRAYECALEERLYFLHPDALNELESKLKAEGQMTETTLTQLLEETTEEDRIIAQELTTAGAAQSLACGPGRNEPPPSAPYGTAVHRARLHRHPQCSRAGSGGCRLPAAHLERARSSPRSPTVKPFLLLVGPLPFLLYLAGTAHAQSSNLRLYENMHQSRFRADSHGKRGR